MGNGSGDIIEERTSKVPIAYSRTYDHFLQMSYEGGIIDEISYS
jgi:hypothetical protein